MSSSSSSSTLAEDSAQLADETEVLIKLMYRNQNQHGKTKYFRYLKAVSISPTPFQSDVIAAVADESCLLWSTNPPPILLYDT